MTKATLRRSDELLNRIEGLLLADQVRAPHEVVEAVNALETAINFRTTATSISLRALHGRVLECQRPLLARNLPPLSRSEAKSTRWKVPTQRQKGWLVVELPKPSGYQDEASWERAVDDTLDRVFHRWCYAVEQVRRAASYGDPIGRLREVESIAWANYYRLLEASRPLRRLGRAA